MPIVSIIIPCYNQAEYLSETLESVLNQTLIDWECIIINDGSPDNTEEIALNWINKDSRFIYLKKENSGLADTRNFGIKHAKSKYILPLDSDDKISTTYLQEAVDILERDSNVKLVYSNAMKFGVEEGEWSLLPYSYHNLLFFRNCIHCSAIYKRSDYNKTIGYNPNMKQGWEDYDFWLSLLAENDKVIKIDKYHFFYRTKKTSMNTEIRKFDESNLRIQLFKNHQDLYLKYINPLEINKELMHYKSISNSTDYKIGRIILEPFRRLRNLFTK